jgi:hypothetical protein
MQKAAAEKSQRVNTDLSPNKNLDDFGAPIFFQLIWPALLSEKSLCNQVSPKSSVNRQADRPQNNTEVYDFVYGCLSSDC